MEELHEKEKASFLAQFQDFQIKAKARENRLIDDFRARQLEMSKALEETNSSFNEKLNNFSSLEEDYKSKFAKLEANYNTALKKNQDEFNIERNELKNASIKVKNEAVEALKKEKKEFTSTLELLKSEHNKKIEALSAEVEKYKKSESNLEKLLGNEKKSSSKKITALTLSKDEISEKLRILTEKIEKDKSKESNLQSDVNNLTQELSNKATEYKKSLAIFTADDEARTKELNKANKSIKSLEEKLKEMNNSLSNGSKKIEEEQLNIKNQFIAELDIVKKQKLEIENKLNTSISENNDLFSLLNIQKADAAAELKRSIDSHKVELEEAVNKAIQSQKLLNDKTLSDAIRDFDNFKKSSEEKENKLLAKIIKLEKDKEMLAKEMKSAEEVKTKAKDDSNNTLILKLNDVEVMLEKEKSLTKKIKDEFISKEKDYQIQISILKQTKEESEKNLLNTISLLEKEKLVKVEGKTSEITKGLNEKNKILDGRIVDLESLLEKEKGLVEKEKAISNQYREGKYAEDSKMKVLSEKNKNLEDRIIEIENLLEKEKSNGNLLKEDFQSKLVINKYDFDAMKKLNEQNEKKIFMLQGEKEKLLETVKSFENNKITVENINTNVVGTENAKFQSKLKEMEIILKVEKENANKAKENFLNEEKELQRKLKNNNSEIKELKEKYESEIKRLNSQLTISTKADEKLVAVDEDSKTNAIKNENTKLRLALQSLDVKNKKLSNLLNEADKKYKNRESTDDDIAIIAHLESLIMENENIIKKQAEEMKFFKLEMINREENLNKMLAEKKTLEKVNLPSIINKFKVKKKIDVNLGPS